MHVFPVYRLELETKLREVLSFTITEKAPAPTRLLKQHGLVPL